MDMQIDVSDVQRMALENWVLRRDLEHAQQVNNELRRRLEHAESPADNPEPTGS